MRRAIASFVGPAGIAYTGVGLIAVLAIIGALCVIRVAGAFGAAVRSPAAAWRWEPAQSSNPGAQEPRRGFDIALGSGEWGGRNLAPKLGTVMFHVEKSRFREPF